LPARGDPEFWFVFRCEGKILWTLLGDLIFPYGDCKKILVASWRLPKKVNFGPWQGDKIERIPV